MNAATPEPVPAVGGAGPVADRPAGHGRAVGRGDRWRWAPAVVAVGCALLLAGVVLSRAERLIEPDPYAYRASIEALEDGNVTLTTDEYQALTTELASSPLGGGILQWHQDDEGRWISEKNPGYPFLAVAFDQVGLLRLAPLSYGGLACVGLWFAGRRWLGRWGGAFAVAGYCSAAVAMVMAWRSTMPTFTDASLVAAGTSALVWVVLAVDRSGRRRTVVGAAAFLALGLAVFVRYTNVAVLAVAVVFALAAGRRSRWRLGVRPLGWWALAAAAPLAATLAYNTAVFEGPFSTGYSSSSVQFSVSAIPDNLRLMPGHLVESMPVFLVALAALVGIGAAELRRVLGRRRHPAASASEADPGVDGDPAGPAAPAPSRPTTGDGGPMVAAPVAGPRAVTEPVRPVAAAPSPSAAAAAVDPAVRDRWVAPFLLGSWLATWGVYAAYAWTAQMGASGAMPGGPDDLTYHIVRFYVPALGPVALLAAWLLVRLPKPLVLVVLTALVVVGVTGFVHWSETALAGLPGGPPGGAAGPGGLTGPVAPGLGRPGSPGGVAFDPSACPPPSSLPGLDPSGGGPFPPPPGGGPPPDLTVDEDGCPVVPATTTTTAVAPG